MPDQPNNPLNFWQDKSTNCFFKVDIIRCVRLTIFIFLLSFADQSFAQSSQIDSLKAILPTMKEDTTRVKLFIEVGKEYRWLEMDSSYAYFNKAIELAEKIDAKGFIADALKDVGINHQIQGKYDSTKHFFQKSLEIASEIGDRKRISAYYAQSASLYHDLGLYDSAIANYFKCLTLAKEVGYESGEAWLYNNIGVVYFEQGLYDESVRYYLKALDLREKLGDRSQMVTIYNNLGEIYKVQDMPDKAIEYYVKAISIHEEPEQGRSLEQGSSLAILYNNIGEIYYSQDSIERAKNYYLKALRLFEELGLIRRMAESTQLLGDIHLIQGNYNLAREYFSSAQEYFKESEDKKGLAGIYVEMAKLEITVADSSAQTEAQRIGYYEDALQLASRSYTLAREMDLLPIVNDAANALMKTYNKLGDHKNGMKWAMIFIETQDSMYREDKIRAIQDMNTKYETEKKQQQIELQESQIIARDAKIKQQKTFKNSLLGGLGAIAIIVFLTSYAYVQKRRDNKRIREKNTQISEANEELKQLNEEITVQKEEIETQRDHLFNQNEAITASINYAQRIQSAMLPPETYINELLDEVFILFKPRDIVSGDFYWIKQVSQYVIVVAADCTGHGVPGAFMSMLGMSFLSEIV
jgi:tetratricopeptide (TPR) repeat protein